MGLQQPSYMWPPYLSHFPTELAFRSLRGRTAFLIPVPCGQGQCWFIFLSLLPWTRSGRCSVNVHCIHCLPKGEGWDVRPQDCSLTFAWVLPQDGAGIDFFDMVVSFSLNSYCCLLSLLLHPLEFLVFQMSIISQFIFQKTLEPIPQRSFILAWEENGLR